MHINGLKLCLLMFLSIIAFSKSYSLYFSRYPRYYGSGSSSNNSISEVDKEVIIGVTAGLLGGAVLATGVGVAAAVAIDAKDREEQERKEASVFIQELGQTATALDKFYADFGLNPDYHLDLVVLMQHGLAKINNRLNNDGDQEKYYQVFQEFLNQAQNPNASQSARANNQLQDLIKTIAHNTTDFSGKDLVPVSAALKFLGARTYPLSMKLLNNENLAKIATILQNTPPGAKISEADQKILEEIVLSDPSQGWSLQNLGHKIVTIFTGRDYQMPVFN